MKTRLFAWLCLAAGLGLAGSVVPRRDQNGSFPAPSTTKSPAGNAVAGSSAERTPSFSRSGNDASHAAEVACALAREGKTEEAWKYCDGLTPALFAECAPLIASIQAATDPGEAWRKVTSFDDETLRAICQKAVLRSASDQNLQKLAGFAATLSDAADRETMLCEIVSRWALQDPAALSRWAGLKEMPETVRDVAASHLVYRGDGLNRSPEIAGAWAESITDAGSRTAAIETAAREWAATDRNAAREFVSRSPHLDPALKDSILTSLAEETPP